MNYFELATRNKLRFDTPIGLLSTEQLFDLPLVAGRDKRAANLDDLAKALYKKLKESEDVSFVAKKTSADKETEVKLEIVKFIIAEKLEKEEQAKKRLATAKQKEQLLGLLAKKQEEKLEQLSEEDILKQLEGL